MDNWWKFKKHEPWSGRQHIVGLLGGIVLGYWLHAMFPDLTSSDSSVSLGGIVGQIVSAFVGGGVLTAICALVKDLLSPRSVS